MVKVTIEDLKRRWLKKPIPPTLFDERRDLFSGRKPRRKEDVEKLAKLAKELFKARFEVRENKLIFKSMFAAIPEAKLADLADQDAEG